MFFEFVIRLDFNKEKLKKGRLKIEKLSALDIMVVENAINAYLGLVEIVSAL